MFSVLIPAKNEENYITLLLDNLRNQTFKDFEIIVADGNSKDKTREIAISYGAKVVKGGHISKSRNSASKIAKGEIFLFFDADVQIENNFIEKTINRFKTQNLDIATVLFDAKNKKISIQILYLFSDMTKLLTQIFNKPFGTGEFIIVKKSLFKKIGGFDENRFVGNDIDFIHRALKNPKIKYRIINTKIIPSDRRLLKNGIIKTVLGSIIGQIITKTQTNSKIKKLLTKIYGGWGNFKQQP